jgi:hypothetical protein
MILDTQHNVNSSSDFGVSVQDSLCAVYYSAGNFSVDDWL